jgi:hypothetical protein
MLFASSSSYIYLLSNDIWYDYIRTRFIYENTDFKYPIFPDSILTCHVGHLPCSIIHLPCPNIHCHAMWTITMHYGTCTIYREPHTYLMKTVSCPVRLLTCSVGHLPCPGAVPCYTLYLACPQTHLHCHEGHLPCPHILFTMSHVNIYFYHAFENIYHIHGDLCIVWLWCRRELVACSWILFDLWLFALFWNLLDNDSDTT